MRVKSIINTKRLVKGAIYDVVKLHNVNGSRSYHSFTIKIKLTPEQHSYFTVNNFVLEDGSPIPQIDWTAPDARNDVKFYDETNIKANNTKIGDFVVYLRNSHSNFVTGKVYKVEDILVTTYKSWSEVSIKLEGTNKYYKAYSFRKCTVEESRKLSLNQFFTEVPGFDKVNKNVRKFDTLSDEEKKQVLIKSIFTSWLDKNRNNLSVLDWAIQKVGESFKLRQEDFQIIMDSKVGELLNS
jgi:hypothetical protein